MGVFSSFTCELRIIQAKNMELKSTGSFFVRCYLSTGNNTKRVKLNSREILSRPNSNFIWDESFSLEGSGSKESIKNLKNQVVVFELRRRRNALGKSQLVGRAEVPWKSVFESPDMEMEKWVMLEVCKKSGEMKDPLLMQVAMKVRVSLLAVEKKSNNKMRLKKNWDEYFCSSGHGYCSCKDYEMFALVAAFEGL